jgi:hypothetical protein
VTVTDTIEIVAALIRDGAGRMLLVRKRGTTAFMQPGGNAIPERTTSWRGQIPGALERLLALECNKW